MTPFALFDTVELTIPLEVEQGFDTPGPLLLQEGQRGKVVEIFDADHALVEFPNEAGESLAVEVVTPRQVRVVASHPHATPNLA